MKKSILVAIISVFAFIGTNCYGQLFTHTKPISTSTACVGSQITMSFYVTGTGTTAPFGSYYVLFGPTIGTLVQITPTIACTSWYSLASSGTITATIPASVTGTYFMFVKHSNIPVASSSLTTIYVMNTPATPTITASGSTSLCPSTSVQLTSSGVGTYSWSTGATTQTISGIAPNTYTVKVTNMCGNATSNPISLTQIPLPTISISGATVGCGSVPLNASASSYTAINWSNSQTGISATATTSANHYATAVNSCGSVNSNTISVTVNSLPNITISPSSSAICLGQSATLTASGANTYTWGTGSTLNPRVVTPPNTTTFSLTGTDGNGCTNTSSVTVIVNPLPPINVSTSNSVLCVGQTATLSATGANSYTWVAGPTTNSFAVSPTVNTTYTVNGTDLNGCSNSIQITQNVTICTGIENSLSNEFLNKLYPVPANDKLNIELSNIDEISNIVINIYSIEGKKVLSEKIYSNNVVLDVSVIEPGMYIVEVISDSWKSTKNIAITR